MSEPQAGHFVSIVTSFVASSASSNVSVARWAEEVSCAFTASMAPPCSSSKALRNCWSRLIQLRKRLCSTPALVQASFQLCEADSSCKTRFWSIVRPFAMRFLGIGLEGLQICRYFLDSVFHYVQPSRRSVVHIATPGLESCDGLGHCREPSAQRVD